MPIGDSNLRWRAKFHKEAYQEDDSTAVLIHDDANDESNTSLKGHRGPQGPLSLTRLQRLWSFCLHGTAGLAIFTAIYSLLHTKTWFLAWTATMTTAVGVLVSWQQSRLARLGSIRTQCQETRKTVHQLRQQNERLTRHLSKFDAAVDRVHDVQGELARIAKRNGGDLARLTPLADEWRLLQLQMQDQLQRQVREALLRAVLETDHNHDFTLTPQEVERLVLRLVHHMPGVVVHEQMLRAQLTASEPSLATMLRLLRVAAQDNPVEATSRDLDDTELYADPSRLMTDDTALFSYNPRELLLLHQQEPRTRPADLLS